MSNNNSMVNQDQLSHEVSPGTNVMNGGNNNNNGNNVSNNNNTNNIHICPLCHLIPSDDNCLCPNCSDIYRKSEGLFSSEHQLADKKQFIFEEVSKLSSRHHEEKVAKSINRLFKNSNGLDQEFISYEFSLKNKAVNLIHQMENALAQFKTASSQLFGQLQKRIENNGQADGNNNSIGSNFQNQNSQNFGQQQLQHQRQQVQQLNRNMSDVISQSKTALLVDSNGTITKTIQVSPENNQTGQPTTQIFNLNGQLIQTTSYTSARNFQGQTGNNNNNNSISSVANQELIQQIAKNSILSDENIDNNINSANHKRTKKSTENRVQHNSGSSLTSNKRASLITQSNEPAKLRRKESRRDNLNAIHGNGAFDDMYFRPRSTGGHTNNNNTTSTPGKNQNTNSQGIEPQMILVAGTPIITSDSNNLILSDQRQQRILEVQSQNQTNSGTENTNQNNQNFQETIQKPDQKISHSSQDVDMDPTSDKELSGSDDPWEGASDTKEHERSHEMISSGNNQNNNFTQMILAQQQQHQQQKLTESKNDKEVDVSKLEEQVMRERFNRMRAMKEGNSNSSNESQTKIKNDVTKPENKTVNTSTNSAHNTPLNSSPKLETMTKNESGENGQQEKENLKTTNDEKIDKNLSEQHDRHPENNSGSSSKNAVVTSNGGGLSTKNAALKGRKRKGSDANGRAN